VGVVEVLVETPRDSRNVYEVDESGRVQFDRRLPGSFAYPADYGYVAGTRASDGEPLDALVLMPYPTYPGVRIRARVVGVFWIMTGHGREAKLVCVPEGDPACREVSELDHLPAHQLAEIAHFFDVYRDLDPGKDVRSDGRDGAAVAWRVVDEARLPDVTPG
jgi:inorganic pyrophosphatase